MLNDLITEYPTVPKDNLEKVLSCAYALASPESNKLGLHNFPIENIPIVAKLMVSKILTTVKIADFRFQHYIL